MKSVLIIVLDGTGAGEAPDSAAWGDSGANTLGHVARAVGGLKTPVMEKLGLGNIDDFPGISRNPSTLASYGKMRELSAGKDTITGHWEMMGIVNPVPFPTYPHGFPPEVMAEFEKRIGRKSLGNKPASGTEIIKELGREHIKTGFPIVYTSADSVFQIAAHVDVIGIEELYKMCQTARNILTPPNQVNRVIARPFTGGNGQFTRIGEKRKDFALPPPGRTVVDALANKGIKVYSIGKVSEMFAMRGFTETIKYKGNMDGMEKTKALLREKKEDRLLFCNLSDFDTLYGHRNDAQGFARALSEFDTALGEVLPLLDKDDYLFITADHGCDPTHPGTDHTRELVPLLFYNKRLKGKDLGLREGFMDLGKTVADIFGVEYGRGKSFLSSQS
jgi:phosphopentomutase